MDAIQVWKRTCHQLGSKDDFFIYRSIERAEGLFLRSNVTAYATSTKYSYLAFKNLKSTRG